LRKEGRERERKNKREERERERERERTAPRVVARRGRHDAGPME